MIAGSHARRQPPPHSPPPAPEPHDDEGCADAACDNLAHVRGFGTVKRAQLARAGVLTRAQLLAEPTLVAALTHEQSAGLRYYAELRKRIRREDAPAVAEPIFALIGRVRVETDCALTTELAGSYRRGLATLGDIDMLINVRSCEESEVMSALAAHIRASRGCAALLGAGTRRISFIWDTSVGGTARVTTAPRAVMFDILSTSPPAYAASLLYFTGSRDFNIRMRATARRAGYSLTQREIMGIDSRQPIPIKREEDVFRIIGMAYVAPTARI